ncbi:MAG: hypothetical protein V1769_06635, partial [Thermoplasmatota archaeon]
MNKQTCTHPCYQTIRQPAQTNEHHLETLELVLFDMDGVLTDTLSCWHFIHGHFGVTNEKSVHAYVSGEIDDLEFIRRDVNLWRKNNELISLAELKSLLDSIPLMQGAKKCIQYLKEHDVK